MESANDYADLTLDLLEQEVPTHEIIEKLNAAAPSGLVVNAAYLAENKAASVVTVADYTFRGECSSAAIEKILASKELIIPKKTKKGIKDTDIRPDIFSITKSGQTLQLRLSAGSARFLHPMTVAEILCEKKPNAWLFSRDELYFINEQNELKTL
jgi:radical SAM-linked protein